MKLLKEILTLVPFVITIAIVLNLVVYQAVEVVYPEPEYRDYCSEISRIPEPTRIEDSVYTDTQVADFKKQCLEAGGLYQESGVVGQIGYCDHDYTCRAEYESARKDHALLLFSVLIISGLFSLLISKQFKNKAVELGFSYGGLFMVIGSLGQLWQIGSQILHLAAIIIVLTGLIYYVNKKVHLDL